MKYHIAETDEHGNTELVNIYNANELSKIVFDNINYYEQLANKANKKSNKTKEEVKQEVLNEYKAENESLKSQLRRSIVILDSDKGLEAYNAFVEKHEKCRMTKATGGLIPYVMQQGHGFGCCTTVYCQVCDAHEDITDTTVW